MGIETIIGLLTGQLGPWIMGALVGLAGLLAARQSGKTAVENKAAQARLKAIEKAKEIKREVNNKSDAEIDREAAKWIKTR